MVVVGDPNSRGYANTEAPARRIVRVAQDLQSLFCSPLPSYICKQPAWRKRWTHPPSHHSSRKNAHASRQAIKAAKAKRQEAEVEIATA